MNNLKKITDKRNVVLITHADCFDGSACAFLFKKYVNQNIITFIKPGNLLKTLREQYFALENYFVVVADIGINDKEMEDGLLRELQAIDNIVILDHHKTSFKFKDELSNFAYFDNDRCGSKLLKDYLRYCGLLRNSKKLNKFINIVDNHDRWVDPKAGTRYCDLQNLIGQENFINKLLESCELDKQENKIIDLLEQKTDRRIQQVLSNDVKILEKNGVQFALVVNSSVDYGKLLKEILSKYEDIKFACRLNIENMTLNFRSRKDYDVSILASNLGGGGHAGAAAAKLNSQEVLELLKEYYAKR
jgi:oligoribonuclease NrnB/cAMP/cGMP phosphodiesterase (DHH superfamily)